MKKENDDVDEVKYFSFKCCVHFKELCSSQGLDINFPHFGIFVVSGGEASQSRTWWKVGLLLSKHEWRWPHSQTNNFNFQFLSLYSAALEESKSAVTKPVSAAKVEVLITRLTVLAKASLWVLTLYALLIFKDSSPQMPRLQAILGRLWSQILSRGSRQCCKSFTFNKVRIWKRVKWGTVLAALCTLLVLFIKS